MAAPEAKITQKRIRPARADLRRNKKPVSESLRLQLTEKRARAAKEFHIELHPTASAILDEGLILVVKHGIGALSMRSVAKLADIKLASLQYHFRTYDELVSTLFVREFAVIADLIWDKFLEIEALDLPPETALRQVASSYMVDENSANNREERVYFHLLAFSAQHASADRKLRAFYDFYNALFAYLIARVNPKLQPNDCLDRAVLITSALEGAGVYTILRSGGRKADHAVHARMGDLAVSCAHMP